MAKSEPKTAWEFRRELGRGRAKSELVSRAVRFDIHRLSWKELPPENGQLRFILLCDEQEIGVVVETVHWLAPLNEAFDWQVEWFNARIKRRKKLKPWQQRRLQQAEASRRRAL